MCHYGAGKEDERRGHGSLKSGNELSEMAHVKRTVLTNDSGQGLP